MRWLLLKDLQILRRSPLLVAVLIAYPILISLLVGLAIDRPPEKPKVAFANLVPPGESSFAIGGRKLDVADYAPRLFSSIDAVRVNSREEAIAKVRSGEVLGAIVIPADATDRLRRTLGLQGGAPPTIEVYYNASDPLKQQLVESTIRSRLGEANDALSDAVLKQAAGYIDTIVAGGHVQLPLIGTIDILGLRRAEAIMRAAIATLPKDAPERVALEQVARFAKLAADNLDVSKPILATIGRPVQVEQTNVSGATGSLSTFFVAVAVTVSLMFITLLLAAGMLALEREEHAFGRLVRGLVSRSALLTEKIGLAALCSLVVCLLMLCGLGIFVELDWARAPAWVLALGVGALGFGAMGAAVGVLTREVQAASLLAFLLSLPIAFLALVPAGAVSSGLYDVINVISGLFPFKPALRALDAALNGGSLATPVLHLLALTAAFAVIARLSLRRFS
jgi:ABC-2 type transport system permease protein